MNVSSSGKHIPLARSMDSEEGVAPRRRALSFRRPAVCAAHGSAVVPPPLSAPLSPRIRAVRHKAIGLIRRTLGSLSNSSTPVGSTESLPDAVFASTNHHAYQHQQSWGSSPPSRPGTPTLAELMAAVSSMPPSPTPHVGFLPRVRVPCAAPSLTRRCVLPTVSHNFSRVCAMSRLQSDPQ